MYYKSLFKYYTMKLQNRWSCAHTLLVSYQRN